MTVKKAFFKLLCATCLLCAASHVVFAADADGADANASTAAVTGSDGDAGDPNNAAVAAAAEQVGADDASTTQGAASGNTDASSNASDAQNPSPPPSRESVNPPNDFGNSSTSRAAFTGLLKNLMPLSPRQIITLHDLFDQSQRAVSQYPGTPPKPTSSSILVNMSPGATPPIIRLRAGYVTSMVFLDSTGQPWPIVGYDLGNPNAFNIQPSAPNGKSNTMLIQASDRYRQGNLAVMLKGEDTPVMLTLIPGQRAVDYRVDLRIPGLGPNALIAMNGLLETGDPMLIGFLDGTPPPGAKPLSVDGAPAQAWSYAGHLFLRARVSVLSPGWLATMNSTDGTHVYEFAKTPVILASQHGQIIQLSIKGL